MWWDSNIDDHHDHCGGYAWTDEDAADSDNDDDADKTGAEDCVYYNCYPTHCFHGMLAVKRIMMMMVMMMLMIINVDDYDEYGKDIENDEDNDKDSNIGHAAAGDDCDKENNHNENNKMFYLTIVTGTH